MLVDSCAAPASGRVVGGAEQRASSARSIIMAHDIIGDIHGHGERLEALLLELGYRFRAGAWRHPDRTAVFVGDLIDRGPGQLRTLELVRHAGRRLGSGSDGQP